MMQQQIFDNSHSHYRPPPLAFVLSSPRLHPLSLLLEYKYPKKSQLYASVSPICEIHI